SSCRDVPAQVVKVRRKSVAGNGEARIVVKDVMKTEAGRRVVTVPPGVMALVAEHVAELDGRAKDFGRDEYPRDALIFSDDALGARPYNPHSANTRFRRASKLYAVAP